MDEEIRALPLKSMTGATQRHDRIMVEFCVNYQTGRGAGRAVRRFSRLATRWSACFLPCFKIRVKSVESLRAASGKISEIQWRKSG